jgi:hypothetical protein
MFRYAAVAVTAATLVVSGTALGAVQSGRVATANYTAGSSQTGVVIVGADVAGQAVGGATIATRRTERTISVTAADDSGRAVAGDVSQRDASGGVHHLTRFCGATSRPFACTGPGLR